MDASPLSLQHPYCSQPDDDCVLVRQTLMLILIRGFRYYILYYTVLDCTVLYTTRILRLDLTADSSLKGRFKVQGSQDWMGHGFDVGVPR